MNLDELYCFDSFAITHNHKNRVHENVVQNDSLRKIVYIGILKFIIFHRIFSLSSFLAHQQLRCMVSLPCSRNAQSTAL